MGEGNGDGKPLEARRWLGDGRTCVNCSCAARGRIATGPVGPLRDRGYWSGVPHPQPGTTSQEARSGERGAATCHAAEWAEDRCVVVVPMRAAHSRSRLRSHLTYRHQSAFTTQDIGNSSHLFCYRIEHDLDSHINPSPAYRLEIWGKGDEATRHKLARQ